MHRRAIAESLLLKFRGSQDICLIYEPNHNIANIIIHNYDAKAALIEATESGPYGMNYCLALCKKIRKQTPGCKLILMCSEQDEENVRQVVNAKGKKLIDDFVFYDVTIDYLVSKLMSI